MFKVTHAKGGLGEVETTSAALAALGMDFGV